MTDLSPASLFLGASLAGSAAGLAFAFAWRWFFPPGVQSRFWIQLSALTQDMLVVDTTREFLAIYRRLGATLAVYLGRNLAITAIGGAALVAALILGLAPLAKSWDARSGVLKAFPAAVDATARRVGDEVRYSLDGATLAVPARPEAARGAVCWTGGSCLALSLLGFTLVEPSAPPKSFEGPVVARASHGDLNPLWPYLSDLEASFVVALMLSMTVAMLWPSKLKDKASEGLILKQSDFALVQINEHFKPLVRLVGRLETRLLGAKLRQTITAPIFITGLARSGTTTVLNALTRSPELGSHQYRDFPFLGAPVTWTKAQGAIARDGAAVERPHKDRILITKLSPEAYEEPLWQQFFSHVHDPSQNQRLTAATSNPRFEAFFFDHIRKILHLRGAGRYVSKGNYNVGRIEYLAKLFPDARFIIPVREPVAHVASLVRQHQLFCGYADTDPRTPHYLAAAGHYEFGRQRRAICLSKLSIPLVTAAFESGDTIGYARQWAEVYGHVAKLKASSLSDRILVVRYEDFCAGPARALGDMLALCDLADPTGGIGAFAAEVSISEAPVPEEVEAQRGDILAIVRETAQKLGYEMAAA